MCLSVKEKTVGWVGEAVRVSKEFGEIVLRNLKLETNLQYLMNDFLVNGKWFLFDYYFTLK